MFAPVVNLQNKKKPMVLCLNVIKRIRPVLNLPTEYGERGRENKAGENISLYRVSILNMNLKIPFLIGLEYTDLLVSCDL